MFCKNKLWEILVVETLDTPTVSLFVSLWQKFDLLKCISAKNHGQIKIILTSSQFTECVQYQVLNQMQQQIDTFLLSFSFLHNFKQKVKL